MTATQTTATSSRRWTVRAGVDGFGENLFEVYAPDMEAARASVLRTAEECEKPSPFQVLLADGFTVHAGDVPSAPLVDNVWVQVVPAPDYVEPVPAVCTCLEVMDVFRLRNPHCVAAH